MDYTKQIKDALDQAIQQKKMTADFAKSVGPAIIDVLKPVLEKIADNSKLPKEEVLKAISNIKVNVPGLKIPTPNITIPKIDVPEIPAPIVNYTPPELTVNVPPLDIKALAARIEMPNEMNVKGWVGFMGYDRGLLSDPLPVQIRDKDGKPVVFGGGGAVINGGGGGGSVRINNPSTEPVNVAIVSGSGATTAVNISDSSGVGYSGSNPLPVTITSGGTATTAVQNLDGDGNYRGTFPVEGTVAVSGISNTVGANIIDSSGVAYSGTNPVPVGGAVSVSGITGSIGATILNGEGLARDSWQVSGFATSVGASLIDSNGVQYSGSNPFPVTWASGSNTSTVSVGTTVSDAVDDGSAPVKSGGIARTANPTAVAGGDIVTMSMDDMGRQLTRPIQVRDLIATAYATLTSGSGFGTETTLLASGSATYLDLIYMMGTNDSDVAVRIDFRASTGGTICKTLEIPASGTAGVALPVPYPAPFTDHTWTIDAPDITGTNVTISALFSKEV